MKKALRLSRKTGLVPGSPVFVGEQKQEKTLINLMDFDSGNYEFFDCKNIDDIFPYKDKESTTWVNVYGLHETEILSKIGKQFNIHPLVMEDVLNTKHRPKSEEFDEYIFFIIKMIQYSPGNDELDIEQISLVMNKNFVLCFQERKGDLFHALRERIKNSHGRIRKSGADYLCYSILDVLIDNYFIVMEGLEEQIDKLEEEALEAKAESIQHINNFKQTIVHLRKNIWPLREMLANLVRNESAFFKESTLPFLRDSYDHVLKVVDSLETYRERIVGVMDIYMSATSFKMNETMKVLTIIATIFIPLSFFAGLYGMNFEFMPELKWKWGYFSLLGFMATILISMLFYFRHKKWI
ncbi:MAG: magnesium and cobalt transport protein CorA [Calditrichaeota bacterium]|nr:MAG: magnesium and cobalt transport protein CorA [Calditrichota bacterium]MBL1203923.1 magnesium and cobalt transport protein CorA [Calditrichota bacterium]NOG43756.1 magnesium/cobalt transporter CorA [Calditrichota bacterium]